MSVDRGISGIAVFLEMWMGTRKGCSGTVNDLVGQASVRPLFIPLNISFLDMIYGIEEL